MQRALLRWGAEVRRDLPWRRTRDPWAVLVAEFMLQQTQVARVVPRFGEFLLRFPAPAACAASSSAEIVRMWAGLGYNRRALHLHRCAVAIADVHRGGVPSDLDALLALPGVGPYTARAVQAFAFEEDVGVVDTNAARVLARRVGRPLRGREVQDLADALVPAGEGWAWNQAMLDLGATVCRARGPECARCPAAGDCAWRARECRPPDPASGSAGVSGGQSRFDGSDRQGRGRLVHALRAGPVRRDRLAQLMGWPDDPERAERVAASVITDGLAVRSGAQLRLAE